MATHKNIISKIPLNLIYQLVNNKKIVQGKKNNVAKRNNNLNKRQIDGIYFLKNISKMSQSIC